MIGIIEFVMILIIVVTAGITFLIWKHKTNWSLLKKVIVTVIVAFGLIAASFIVIFMWIASTEDLQGMRVKEVNVPLNKFEYTAKTSA